MTFSSRDLVACDPLAQVQGPSAATDPSHCFRHRRLEADVRQGWRTPGGICEVVMEASPRPRLAP
jgi:hypothetical protein